LGEDDVARPGRLLAGVAGVLLFAFVGGFVIFASSVTRYTPPVGERADGIVVLTGGLHRLGEASRLLAEGRGRRLLISGANPVATRHELYRASGLSLTKFSCCVDVGYQAHDTMGNAEETRAWANAKGFSRLIIVTSRYHMPRSLIELARAMPNAALVPYPVVSRNFRSERWWMHGATARLLFSEYVKFLPSAARFGMARLIRSWDGSALADSSRLRASSL
jgi:uncharacterized SAM-binding protein YcdF (DUF218 family)